jgi:CheY-like chemotaxis protein
MGAAEQLNILVMDDEPAICELYQNILFVEGHQVISVASAEDGLNQLPFYKFQVAFLDHNLPGMEGLVFGEYLRRNNPYMQIALVTGSATKALHRLAEEHGIGVIEKPFKVNDLRDVVSRYRELDVARQARLEMENRSDFAPSFHAHLESLEEVFGIPGVPKRIEAILTARLKRLLNSIRSGHGGEEARVAFISGVLASYVLGLHLPKTHSDRTLADEFDELMSEGG